MCLPREIADDMGRGLIYWDTLCILMDNQRFLNVTFHSFIVRGFFWKKNFSSSNSPVWSNMHDTDDANTIIGKKIYIQF